MVVHLDDYISISALDCVAGVQLQWLSRSISNDQVKKGCSGTRLDDETRSTKLRKLTDTQENKRREELSDLNSVDFTATCEPCSQEAVPGKYLPIAIQ